ELTAEDPLSLPSEDIAPTAFRPVLYPWLLHWLVQAGRVDGAAVVALHLLLGLASVVLTFAIAERLGVVGWIPALAVACDPLLLRASQRLMTESLATVLILGGWYLLLRLIPDRQAAERLRPQWWLGLVVGALMGAGVLARPTLAPWAALCGLWVLAVGALRRSHLQPSHRSLRWPRNWTVIASYFIGLSIVVGGWTMRNQSMLGRPIWATTHGGYTLLLANNPMLYQHFRERGPDRNWDAVPFHQAWNSRWEAEAETELSPFWSEKQTSDVEPSITPVRGLGRSQREINDNEFAYEAAWATINESLLDFVGSCVYRVGWFWAFWPAEPMHLAIRTAIGAWYMLAFLLAVVGVWRLVRRGGEASFRLDVRRWLPGLLLLISLTCIHGVYWSNMRMRAPLMPVIYLVGAISIQAWTVARFRNHSGTEGRELGRPRS
ncbi:MAG: ArnT family glycosyltransferase, partial [Pirellulaceae bacterium]